MSNDNVATVQYTFTENLLSTIHYKMCQKCKNKQDKVLTFECSQSSGSYGRGQG